MLPADVTSIALASIYQVFIKGEKSMQYNALTDDDRIKSKPIYVTPEYPAAANHYVCVAEPDALNLIMEHMAPIDKHRTPFHFIVCADRAGAPPAGLPSEWQNVPLQCCERDALSTTLAIRLEALTQSCHVTHNQ